MSTLGKTLIVWLAVLFCAGAAGAHQSATLHTHTHAPSADVTSEHCALCFAYEAANTPESNPE